MLARSHTIATIFVLVASFAMTGRAADRAPVQIEELHLCCGKCSDALTEALASVDGINDIDVDRKTGSARFFSPSAEKTEAALAAMASAGFFGTALQGDKVLAIPAEEIDADLKSDRIVFTGVHLCCGGCARGVAKGFEDQKEVVAVDCDTDAGTVTLTGKDLSVAEMRDTLNKAGFHGKLVRK